MRAKINRSLVLTALRRGFERCKLLLELCAPRRCSRLDILLQGDGALADLAAQLIAGLRSEKDRECRAYQTADHNSNQKTQIAIHNDLRFVLSKPGI